MEVTDATPYLPNGATGRTDKKGLRERYAKRVPLSKVGAIESTTTEPKNAPTVEALL
jgi:hypothetical protein